MPTANHERRLATFGPYTVDLAVQELRKFGVRVPLQSQPFLVLAVLLERPNELITREELQRRIWPSGTFVDFEQGLNKAVNKLRVALCDAAEEPRYIETVPRLGYRFIATVEVAAPSGSSGVATVVPEPVPVPNPDPIRHFFERLWAKKLEVLTLAALLTVVAGLLIWWPSTPNPQTIAVLPLVAHGGNAEYDLADGLTDSIINNLSLVPNLTVISHASVFRYRGQEMELGKIGRQLGVASVLTGRVQQNGTTLTVNVELTRTADQTLLWGQEYTRDISQRAALSQEVAVAVADTLRLKLTPTSQRQIINQNTEDAEAQQLYLKGRYYFFKETPDDVLQARDLFQQAIDRDPGFALAYSSLGDTYDWMATEGYQPLGEVVQQATAAKRKANELNGALAEVHASLASLEFVQWNWANAEIEFQRALRINPNYFEAHRLYSIYLRTMKRFPEAIEHAKLCAQLNPLLEPVKSHLALTYYYAGQYDAALEQYRLILKDNPDSPGAHAGRSEVFAKLGREKEAIEEWQQALELQNEKELAQDVGKAYARGGLQAARAERLRAELKLYSEHAKREYVSPLEFAYRHALLGEKDKAFVWLEMAYSDRSPQLFNVNVDPDFESLRGDPRWSGLLARLHLPE